MIGYPYIEQLFRNILKQSKVIQGRFFITHDWTAEVNSSSIVDILEKAGIPDPKKTFPLCLMLAPRSQGDYASDRAFKDLHDISLLFLTGTYYTSTGDVKEPAPGMNNISDHTVIEDWHDMKRCGKSFMRVLSELIMDHGASQFVSISNKQPQVMQPMSTVGTKRLSGIHLTFGLNVHSSCELEDYEPDFASKIEIPTEDSHPQHLH